MADSYSVNRNRAAWRDKWYVVIFRHDTFGGRLFDVVLLTLILLSVLIVILESVSSIRGAIAHVSAAAGQTICGRPFETFRQHQVEGLAVDL